MQPFYNNIDNNTIEVGIDEVGRGPLFGRIYTAAVILPKNNNFSYNIIKDSKKYTSKKKLNEVAEYIKSNCINYAISFIDEKDIDNINILKATHKCMHSTIKKLNLDTNNKILLLIDGNNFKPYTFLDKNDNIIKEIESVCIEKGDNKITSIAAASILAKVERDNYINELCNIYPKLIDCYDLNNNKGYGTKKHIQGIQEYGITSMHRKSFGICKYSKTNDII